MMWLSTKYNDILLVTGGTCTSEFLTYCTTYVGLVWWSSSFVILSVRDLGIFTLFCFSCLLLIWIKEGRVTIVYGSSQFYHESGAAFSWETDSVAMSCVILHARQPLPVNFGRVNFPFCILVNIYSVHTYIHHAPTRYTAHVKWREPHARPFLCPPAGIFTWALQWRLLSVTFSGRFLNW